MRNEKILKELMTNGCIEIQDTIDKYNISERTLRSDILSLRTKFKIDIMKKGSYYILNSIVPMLDYSQQKADFNSKIIRLKYIVSELFKNKVKAKKILDELFISNKLLNDDIQHINNEMRCKVIDFVKDNGELKISLIGEETVKRKLFEKYLDFENHDFFEMKTYFQELLFENSSISAYSLQEFVKKFYIMTVRIKNNEFVNFKSNLKIRETNLLNTIQKYLDSRWNIKLNEQELNYLKIICLSHKIIEQDIPSLEENVQDFLISNFNLEMKKVLVSEEYKNFLNHIRALIIRNFEGIYFSNPYINKIKSNYPWHYEISLKLSKFLESRLNIKDIKEYELGLLAIHLKLIEIKYSKAQTSNYLISDEKNIITNILLETIKQQIVELSNLKLLTSKEVNLTKFKPSDFIIIVGDKKINHQNKISIEPVVDEKWINLIREKMNFKNLQNSFAEFNKYFLETDKLNDIDEIFKVMVNKLGDSNEVKRNLIISLRERESKSSTYIGNFCAIPHTENNLKLVKNFNLYFFKNGVLWNKKIVYFVFLINVSSNKQKDLKEIFKAIIDFKKNINQKILMQINSQDDLENVWNK